MMGTCYRRRQCSSIDGISSGSCAKGIGVCCVVHRTCGQSSSYNNTYFTNTNYPNSDTGGTRCTMTIIRCNPDICQARIDFLSLSLAQPDANGFCTTDALQITGGAGTVPAICGENSGQHIYVDFNGNDNIQMAISTAATALMGRNWNFKVTQIGCDCPTRAPSGCLMYYTALSGTVNSFNYGTTLNAINPQTGEPGTKELVFENYGVCISMAPGYCSIEWSQAGPNSFITTGSPSEEPGTYPPDECLSDFVVIPNPYYPNGTAVGGDRFCGTAFPTVITSSKPFVLTVVTNGNETGDQGNIGFSLNYRQLPCTTGLTQMNIG
ncbi:unnamed protein product [Brassicogethes aeneus]|uniref:CUB domain-containing protein n=1 Tax=Brassicogethes aeneus TaxID=1431903 RepID=A0A9P0FAJ8_BRAAE|nr:unnamed protein product [Brassicogethes aeneus]